MWYSLFKVIVSIKFKKSSLFSINNEHFGLTLNTGLKSKCEGKPGNDMFNNYIFVHRIKRIFLRN